jgi:hypothetical protein
MHRKDVYKRLVASETYWFGGVRETPKVFEAGTRHHVDPIVPTVGVADVAGADVPREDFVYSVDLATGELSVHPAAAE